MFRYSKLRTLFVIVAVSACLNTSLLGMFARFAGQVAERFTPSFTHRFLQKTGSRLGKRFHSQIPEAGPSALPEFGPKTIGQVVEEAAEQARILAEPTISKQQGMLQNMYNKLAPRLGLSSLKQSEIDEVAARAKLTKLNEIEDLAIKELFDNPEAAHLKEHQAKVEEEIENWIKQYNTRVSSSDIGKISQEEINQLQTEFIHLKQDKENIDRAIKFYTDQKVKIRKATAEKRWEYQNKAVQAMIDKGAAQKSFSKFGYRVLGSIIAAGTGGGLTGLYNSNTWQQWLKDQPSKLQKWSQDQLPSGQSGRDVAREVYGGWTREKR